MLSNELVPYQSAEGNGLCVAPFLRDSLLVDFHRDPWVGVTKEFLGNLDIDLKLPQEIGEAMAEAVPSDLLDRLPDMIAQEPSVRFGFDELRLGIELTL